MGNTIQMTTAGWAFLGCAWAGVVGLMVFCFAKLFTVRHDAEPDQESDEE